MSKWCPSRGVSLHKDQLVQDSLTFRQNRHMNFFHYIFSLFFTVLFVHPHHDHPLTTVLTHCSPMAWYSLFVLKVPLNTTQPTSEPCYVLRGHSIGNASPVRFRRALQAKFSSLGGGASIHANRDLADALTHLLSSIGEKIPHSSQWNEVITVHRLERTTSNLLYLPEK